jgi:glycosyltransferase involved in cell wall biosynthesis
MLRGVELQSALSAATVWALPSKTENFGSSVVEALAAGVPVVVSPEVNLAPAIRAAEAGVVCDRTVSAFANSIASLLDSASLRADLGGRGREFAQAYDWTHVAPQLIKMYTAVASTAHLGELAEACA